MNTTSTELDQPLCLKTTLRIMGDQWTGLILGELSSNNTTFSGLEAALPSISPRTLSQRLDKLETEGIVAKEQYCERPPRYKYVPTQKGVELQEVLTKMAEWGAKYQVATTESCDS